MASNRLRNTFAKISPRKIFRRKKQTSLSPKNAGVFQPGWWQGSGDKFIDPSHRTFFNKVPHHDEPLATGFQKALDALDPAEKKKLLLTPLSEQTRENALSYIVADRNADKHEWRTAFLTTALDEIEKLEVPAEERLDVLTSANELGQTLFHKVLKFDDKELFNLLEARLRKWGGDEYANTFLQNFHSEPLGTLDDKVSWALSYIYNGIRPYGSEHYRLFGAVSNNNYKPATYKGLKNTIDNKVRPCVQQWVDKNRPENMSRHSVDRYELLKAFAKNANAVRLEGKIAAPAAEEKTPLKKPSRWQKLNPKRLFRRS